MCFHNTGVTWDALVPGWAGSEADLAYRSLSEHIISNLNI